MGTSSAPTALHRVAAWCVAALFVALVAVGTRAAMRALAPKLPSEAPPGERAQTEPADVDDPREPAAPRASALVAAGEASPRQSQGARRAVGVAEDAPLERHPAFVIEGHVRFASRAGSGWIELEVDHPQGGTATTRLFFDRPAPDGDGLVAPFKLIKPAQGTYVLRPRLRTQFDYEIQPPEMRVDRSASGLRFLVRDDVEHVDLDLIALGEGGGELRRANFHWRVHRGGDPLGLLSVNLGRFLAAGVGPDLRGVPVTNGLEFLVTAEGHRPRLVVLTPKPGQRTLEIALEPGWGLYLQDRSRHIGGRSVGEVPSGEVVLDGRSWGLTDRSGTTWVEAATRPRKVEVWFGKRRARLIRGGSPFAASIEYRHDFLETE